MPSAQTDPSPNEPQNRCRIAVLTPAGRGAVATIAVSGEAAVDVVGRHFQPLSGRSLTDYQPGSIVVGHFRSTARAGEELVVGMIGPHEVEVHCHGGQAAVQAIVDALIAGGCAVGTAADYASRHSGDPLAAEAIVALGQATTEKTAALLLAQYRGALRTALLEVVAHLESGNGSAGGAQLEQLCERGAVGLHLVRPWLVVLVGRPNVGKSSLINALLGYQRSIVYDEPGTTRDVLSAYTALAGWPIELSDTAGFRLSASPLEAAGIEGARRQLQQADLAVAVFEHPARWSDDDAALLQQLPETRRLVVFNKSDLPAADNPRPPGLLVSARTGDGLDSLAQAIIAQLIPQEPELHAALPFTRRQMRRLVAARNALAADKPSAASAILRSLLGEAS